MRAFLTLSLASVLLGKIAFSGLAQESCDSAEASDHSSYLQNAVRVQIESLVAAPNLTDAELHEDQVAATATKKKKQKPKNVVFTATMYGAGSALSLPLGALLGIVFHPVNKLVVSRLMAFGAGALLFAVTVEMYGEMLRDMELETERDAEKPDKVWEVHQQARHHRDLMNLYGRSVVCMLACLMGAWLYMKFNQYLNEWARKASPGEVAREKTPDVLDEPTSPVLQSKVAMMAREVSDLALEPEAPPTVADCESEDKPEEELSKKWATALAILCGTYVDGISEGVLIGAMARHGSLSVDFVVSVFVANLPEAFSTSSMLRDLKVPNWKIMMAWFSLVIITGFMSLISCFTLSSLDKHGAAAQLGTGLIEGLAAGAMLMMIVSVMVPEVIEVEGDTSALIMILGFIVSICIGVSAGYVEAWGHPNCIVETRHIANATQDVIFCE